MNASTIGSSMAYVSPKASSMLPEPSGEPGHGDKAEAPVAESLPMKHRSHQRRSMEQQLAEVMKSTHRVLESKSTGKLDLKATVESEIALAALEHTLHQTFREVEVDRQLRQRVLLEQLFRIDSGNERQASSRSFSSSEALKGARQAIDGGQNDHSSELMGEEAIYGDDPPPSFADLLDRLQALIGGVRGEYLDVYAEMVKRYADFFGDFSREIVGMMGDWVEGASQGGKVRLKAAEMKATLEAFINRYKFPNPAAVLYPASGGASRAEAEEWLKAMDLPDHCLQRRPDGTYCVVMDVRPLEAIRDSINNYWVEHSPFEMDAAEFQAWQSGFNAQQQELESALQRYSQKYSNANSIHDNLQKTISSTLSSLFDMLKAFAASLG